VTVWIEALRWLSVDELAGARRRAVKKLNLLNRSAADHAVAAAALERTMALIGAQLPRRAAYARPQPSTEESKHGSRVKGSVHGVRANEDHRQKLPPKDDRRGVLPARRRQLISIDGAGSVWWVFANSHAPHACFRHVGS
jgi:hypothetical protein